MSNELGRGDGKQNGLRWCGGSDENGMVKMTGLGRSNDIFGGVKGTEWRWVVTDQWFEN